MDRRFVGSVLLIAGTSVGAGMLVLPVVLATEGFLTTALLLLGSWLVMTFGAFLILEANLWFPANSNIISMAKSTMGRIGQIIAWVTYLLLLYSLLCAYISSISDILHTFLFSINLHTKQWVDAVIIVFLFGGIVWCGMTVVDFANRFFVSVKFISYFLLVLAIAPHVNLAKLLSGNSHIHVATIMVIITSFGFSPIIPSLRVYLKGDVRKLRRAILIGSTIPLVLYFIWITVVHGFVEKEGANGLLNIAASGQVTSELTRILSYKLNSFAVSVFVHSFIDVCAATSFLGVSLCLTDFLSDGLKLRKKGLEGILIYCCTFIPPIIIILFSPSIFVKALNYAGLFCVVLLMLFPILMVWNGRYRQNRKGSYSIWGGKPLLILGAIVSVVLIVWNMVSYFS